MKIRKKYYISLIFVLAVFCAAIILTQPSKNDIERGIGYIDQFEFEKATNFFLKYVQNNPKSAMANHYLGKAIKGRLFYARYKAISQENESKLFYQAEESFIKSLELNPKLSDSIVQLAELYSYKRKYKEALKQYQILENRGESSPELYKSIGKIYTKLNKIQLARKYYTLAGANNFTDHGTDKILDLKIINHLIISSKDRIVNSQIKWVILDSLVFDGAVENKKYAEQIIQDVYFACLSHSLKMIGKNTDNPINAMEIDMIINCNNEKLKNFGIKIENINLIFGKQPGKSS
jgi:tetratricopeptide (TPR) repeat protein